MVAIAVVLALVGSLALLGGLLLWNKRRWRVHHDNGARPKLVLNQFNAVNPDNFVPMMDNPAFVPTRQAYDPHVPGLPLAPQQMYEQIEAPIGRAAPVPYSTPAVSVMETPMYINVAAAQPVHRPAELTTSANPVYGGDADYVPYPISTGGVLFTSSVAESHSWSREAPAVSAAPADAMYMNTQQIWREPAVTGPPLPRRNLNFDA